MPVYALVVAGKAGIRPNEKGLQESAPDATAYMKVSFGQSGQITATKSRMEQLVAQLYGAMDRPVLDKTGLTGDFEKCEPLIRATSHALMAQTAIDPVTEENDKYAHG